MPIYTQTIGEEIEKTQQPINLNCVFYFIFSEIEALDSCGDAKFALARLLSAAARGNLLKDPSEASSEQQEDCAASHLGG